ncbi:unnamed protein product [Coffea canephora]|uniref:Mitochondrial intermembrane space import and assembly protein 40 homolog n=2 Tax=Coffea TaxID=13442 RepID=A0A068VBC8_COFCA|nr:mitochondrial intermembrane space import and assembly protein 40 homolog [Coffea arabica]CDP18125.1 unnamed protein product [Coffea canephora]
MGQVQSQPVGPEDEKNPSSAHPTGAATDDQNSSLDSLIAEAAAFGDEDENLSVEEKAQRALECPCIAHLRTGPCGFQFSNAFLCFLKSTAPEKGSDCVHPFVALQNCIKANPDAFSKDILEDDEIKKKDGEIKKEEKPSKEYKIHPPLWSVESKKSKHKS